MNIDGRVKFLPESNFNLVVQSWLTRSLLVAFCTLSFGNAYAIPALQLGPGNIGNWTFNNATQTWITSTGSFELNAYANSDTPGNGAYAWESAGATDQQAYLIFAATPDVGNVGDAFDVSVSNDGGALTLVDSGYGNPPINDPNSLSPHGIFDTYFEIYEFDFDGSVTTIGNTQPSNNDTGDGYVESFDISVNSLFFGAIGVHFDLFTVGGDGIYDALNPDDKKMVNAVAPYSHDAAYVVPVPAAFWLFGTALIGFIGISRRRSV